MYVLEAVLMPPSIQECPTLGAVRICGYFGPRSSTILGLYIPIGTQGGRPKYALAESDPEITLEWISGTGTPCIYLA